MEKIVNKCKILTPINKNLGFLYNGLHAIVKSQTDLKDFKNCVVDIVYFTH